MKLMQIVVFLTNNKKYFLDSVTQIRDNGRDILFSLLTGEEKSIVSVEKDEIISFEVELYELD